MPRGEPPDSPAPALAGTRRRLTVLALALALPACGGDVGQSVQDGAERRAVKEIDRIVDSASGGGRERALREIDRLERATGSSGPVRRAADRARARLERQSP